MTDFATYLMQVNHMLIVVSVWVLMSIVRRMLPAIADHHAYAYLSPVLPIILCSLAVWIPGLTDGSVATRIMLGIVLGAMAANGHKIVRQTVLGDDQRIRNRGGVL